VKVRTDNEAEGGASRKGNWQAYPMANIQGFRWTFSSFLEPLGSVKPKQAKQGSSPMHPVAPGW
jgi:hypothetical protein